MDQVLESPLADFRRAQRLGQVGVSEILRIEAKAAALRRQGRDVIVLAAGEPDFDTPDHIKAAGIAAINAGETKYTALTGTIRLREAIQEKFRRDNGLEYGLDQICATTGAKQALHSALLATLDAGDEVVIPAPFWTSYADMVRIAGGKVVAVPTLEENGFRVAVADLERAISGRTRWVLLNSPSNPSGATYTVEQLRPVLEAIRRHPQVWLMCDDIYEHIIYDGRKFVSPASVDPDLLSRTLVVNGVSKAYAMTGWRLGFAAGPKEMIRAIAAVQSQSTSAPSAISQAAAAEALTGPQFVVQERRLIFQGRRDALVDRLNAVEGIHCPVPEGAFYVLPRCSDLFGSYTGDGRRLATDSDFCAYLLDAYAVAVVPGSCFAMPGYFRISYAASDERLKAACDRIAEACARLQRT